MNVTLCLLKEIFRFGRTCNLRVRTANVGIMSGRGHEVVEILRHFKLNIYCVQETHWRGLSPRKIKRKDWRSWNSAC